MTEMEAQQLKHVEEMLESLMSHVNFVNEYNTKLRAENERAFKLNDRIEALLPKLEKMVAGR